MATTIKENVYGSKKCRAHTNARRKRVRHPHVVIPTDGFSPSGGLRGSPGTSERSSATRQAHLCHPLTAQRCHRCAQQRPPLVQRSQRTLMLATKRAAQTSHPSDANRIAVQYETKYKAEGTEPEGRRHDSPGGSEAEPWVSRPTTMSRLQPAARFYASLAFLACAAGASLSGLQSMSSWLKRSSTWSPFTSLK